jgi:citrate lyase subunit beta / citryl-CoA lyase
MATSFSTRTLLYVPASNEKALAKAAGLACDALILDLEDAVASQAKPVARVRAFELIEAGTFGSKPVFLRLNGLETAFAKDDFAMALQCKALTGIVVPKVSSAEDITNINLHLMHARPDLQFLVMIETPMAVLNLREIAETSAIRGSRLAGFILGLNDLEKETGINPGLNRHYMHPVLLQSVLVAKAYGLKIYDGVYNDFNNEAGLRLELSITKAFGFDGKTLIHPSQIEPTHQAFRGSAAEISEAKVIISAFELPENATKGAINLGGKMVERLHLEIARQFLERNR